MFIRRKINAFCWAANLTSSYSSNKTYRKTFVIDIHLQYKVSKGLAFQPKLCSSSDFDSETVGTCSCAALKLTLNPLRGTSRRREHSPFKMLRQILVYIRSSGATQALFTRFRGLTGWWIKKTKPLGTCSYCRLCSGLKILTPKRYKNKTRSHFILCAAFSL